jgi:hypothetical protein
MMDNLSETTIKKKITDFLIHKRTASHGRMIIVEEAQKCGLKINEIILRSKLWNWLWELYVRGDWAVTVRGGHKIIESANSALSASG